MTEIRVDVDLEHPPPAVWRALTEAHLVTDWLATTQLMVRDDGTFTFQAAALAGLEDPIEGEVVTTEAARRLVMRWSGENLHTVVAITLDERAGGGTRLTLTQSGFLGPQGTMRRRVLRTTYQQLFEGPFAAALARQAAATPAVPDTPAVVRRNDGGPFNRLPRQPHAPSRSAPGLSSQMRSTAGPRSTTTMPGFAAAVLGARATGVAAVSAPGAGETTSTHRLGSLRSAVVALVRRAWRRTFAGRDWSADRRSQAVAAGAAILLLVAMSALLVGKATAPHPAKPPRTGGGVEGPAQATVPAAPTEGSPRAATISSTSASASAPPATATPAPSAVTPGGAQLTAQARAENLTLTSYRVTVTIANPGPAPSADWTVTVVLPLLDLAVRNVDGAVMTRSGLKVVFTPVDTTRTIRPSGSATLRFEVEGLGVRNAPIDCTIDGRPCTQVSG